MRVKEEGKGATLEEAMEEEEAHHCLSLSTIAYLSLSLSPEKGEGGGGGKAVVGCFWLRSSFVAVAQTDRERERNEKGAERTIVVD